MRWKKTVSLFSCLVLLVATAKFCKKQTAGFTIAKVQNNFDLEKVSQERKNSSIPEEIQMLLQQPYHYLSQGKQSFVFASEDGKYVLKLFNNRYQRKAYFFSLLSHLHFISHWAQINEKYNRYKLHRTFTSYALAIDKLKEETEVLHLHVDPAEKSSPLHIVDRLGIHHNLPASKTAFLLQKRAQPFYQSLSALKKKGDNLQAGALLDSLFDLLISRYSKGIFDNDPLLRTNFGFIDNKAIEIDVGPFSEDSSMKDPTIYCQEIVKTTTSLKHWLEENYIELLPELENQYLYKLQLESL